MNHEPDHDCTVRCLCHLSREAQALYLDMLYADRLEEAEALRTSGTRA